MDVSHSGRDKPGVQAPWWSVYSRDTVTRSPSRLHCCDDLLCWENDGRLADVSRAADCGFFCDPVRLSDWLTMPPWPVLDFSMLLKFPAANTTSRVSDGLPEQELCHGQRCHPSPPGPQPSNPLKISFLYASSAPLWFLPICRVSYIKSTMFSITLFEFPHFHLRILLASVCFLRSMSCSFCIFPSASLPSPALESTFAQFNCDTRTISFMADYACVFSIKSGSCTLFIWGNHNSHGPAEN